MYGLIAERRVADVVYGSRFHGRSHRSLYVFNRIGNWLISTLFNLLYNQTLSDIECCYKMFTREVLQTLALSADDFGIEVQISAQIALARRWRVYETGIQYFGRTYAEGKKIKWRDGVKALWYLFRYSVCSRAGVSAVWHPHPSPPPQGERGKEASSPSPLVGEGRGEGWAASTDLTPPHHSRRQHRQPVAQPPQARLLADPPQIAPRQHRRQRRRDNRARQPPAGLAQHPPGRPPPAQAAPAPPATPPAPRSPRAPSGRAAPAHPRAACSARAAPAPPRCATGRPSPYAAPSARNRSSVPASAPSSRPAATATPPAVARR